MARFPGTRRWLLALLVAASVAGACSTGPQPPATMQRSDVRLQLFDFLSAFASEGPKRQAVLFLFADEKTWTYKYLGDREWSVLMPTEADGQRLLDQPAEWRINEATKLVRPANDGAEAILRGLQAPLAGPPPTS